MSLEFYQSLINCSKPGCRENSETVLVITVWDDNTILHGLVAESRVIKHEGWLNYGKEKKETT